MRNVILPARDRFIARARVRGLECGGPQSEPRRLRMNSAVRGCRISRFSCSRKATRVPLFNGIFATKVGRNYQLAVGGHSRNFTLHGRAKNSPMSLAIA